MRAIPVRVACLVVAGTFVTSCSMTEEARNQVFGGVGGALGGAAIGAVASGGDPKAIGAGAAAGAIVGWGAVKLAQYHAERTGSAKQEAEVLGYSGQGTMLNIRDAGVTPASVKPGQPVNFTMDYAVLAPKETTNIPVEETWELEKDGKVVTTTAPQAQQRQPGGWQTRASITVPPKATPGTYIVKNRVSAFGTRQERVAYFNVI